MAAGVAQKLTPLLTVERLSDRVIRILGCNPGHMTLQGTNTYLIGQGKRKILVDTSHPNIPEYVKTLKQTLQDHSSIIQEIIITHWHSDHVGGVADIHKDLLTEPVKVSKFERLSVQDVDVKPASYTFVKDNHVFTTEGATLRAIHTPGHTEDHMILYLEEENAVFAGDTILGESTAVFEDLHAYMQSLQKMLDLKPSVIYPGHGVVIKDPIKMITYYINHRNEREAQIIATLEKHQPEYLSTLEIVNIVYEGLSSKLIPSACGSASHHLKKLVKDMKVELKDDGEHKWRLIECSTPNL